MSDREQATGNSWLSAHAKAMLESTGEGVLSLDRQGLCTFANASAGKMLGYDPGEIMGANLHALIHYARPDGSPYPEEACPIYRAFRTGESCRVTEEGFWRKDGSFLPVEYTSYPIVEEGVITGAVVTFVDITERWQVEEALRNSEERYRALYEDNPSMYFTLDAQGTVLSVNRFGAEQLGYTPEEIVGYLVLDVFHEEDREGVARCLDEALQNPERTTSWEARKVRKDGSIIWVQENVRVVQSPESETVILVVCEDITERKKAEEQILFQAQLLEQVQAAVIATDLQGTVMYWNEHAEKLYGWSREETLGRNITELTVGPQETGIAGEIMEQLRAGEPWEGEFEVQCKDGSTFFAHVTDSLIYDAREQVVGIVGVSMDITERKKAEEEVRARARQQAVVARLGQKALEGTELQDLLDEAVALVAQTLDVEYCKVLELLPDGEELLLRAGVGWKEGRVGSATVGVGLDSQAGYILLSSEPVIVEDLSAENRFSGPPLLHEHGVVSGMSVVIHGRAGPFGELGAHTTSRRTFTADDVNFLQSVANVLSTAVERREIEEELREIREAERSRMARDLHDEALQDLVNVLQAMRDTSTKSEAPQIKAELEGEIETLERAVLGVRGAIYDLRLNEDREQTFTEMLEYLLELNRQSSPGREIELSVEEGFTPPLGRTRQTELLRIIQEALANVRRHSGARHAWVAVGASEGRLRVEVSDDGRGFDPESSGMGIKGMHERARTLGGELKITSKPGEGTTVRFEASLAEDRQEPVRILLVEDHASFRQAAASVIEKEPEFTVVGQAGSLDEARRMLERVDVAVVDLSLPDGYGGDLIRELRATNPHAIAIVLSATLDRAELARAVESGAAGILHKSADMKDVVDAVRRAQAGETLLPLEEVVELLRYAGSRREQEYKAQQAISQLTPREKEVLQALAEGLDGEEIAERLHISAKTERNHMASIFAKLEVHSRLQALVFALRHGVVSIR